VWRAVRQAYRKDRALARLTGHGHVAASLATAIMPMPLSVTAKLFEEFTQADASTAAAPAVPWQDTPGSKQPYYFNELRARRPVKP
jgi:alkylation response protein AidB-like acyl-CoA dehydrogenase